MSEVARRFLGAIAEFAKLWSQPHRRAALLALLKASALLGTISELGWLLNTHYFSRYFPQLPISLAWSMLTVIFFTTWAQVSFSIALKLRSARRTDLMAAAQQRWTPLLAAYVSGEDLEEEIEKAAQDSPKDFEAHVAAALLGLRGSALERLCQLPAVSRLRLKWMERSRTGDDTERRYAVEQMALLCDPSVIPALENALNDAVDGVVASAVRGLLQMDFYSNREELIRSLRNRSYLVRVLTACESPADVAPATAVAAGASISYGSAEVARASCSGLAALGEHGRDLLRLMAALGQAGDAPAEALGESLAAAARGGAV